MSVDETLLENGSYLLLESGGVCEYLLLESSDGIPSCGSCSMVGLASVRQSSALISASKSSPSQASTQAIKQALISGSPTGCPGICLKKIGASAISESPIKVAGIGMSRLDRAAVVSGAVAIDSKTPPIFGSATLASSFSSLAGVLPTATPASRVSSSRILEFSCAGSSVSASMIPSLPISIFHTQVSSIATAQVISQGVMTFGAAAVSAPSSAINSSPISQFGCGIAGVSSACQISSYVFTSGAGPSSLPLSLIASQAISPSSTSADSSFASPVASQGLSVAGRVGFSGSLVLMASQGLSVVGCDGFAGSSAIIVQESLSTFSCLKASLSTASVGPSWISSCPSISSLTMDSACLSSSAQAAISSNLASIETSLVCSSLASLALTESHDGSASLVVSAIASNCGFVIPSSEACMVSQSIATVSPSLGISINTALIGSASISVHGANLASFYVEKIIVSGMLSAPSTGILAANISAVISQAISANSLESISLSTSALVDVSFSVPSTVSAVDSSAAVTGFVCSLTANVYAKISACEIVSSAMAVSSQAVIDALGSTYIGLFAAKIEVCGTFDPVTTGIMQFFVAAEVSGFFGHENKIGGMMASIRMTGSTVSFKITGGFEMPKSNVFTPRYRGESFEYFFTLEECGTDYDISTWTFKVEFRNSSNTVVFTRSTGFNNTGEKTMSFSLSSAETLTIPAGDLTFLLWRTDSSHESVLSTGSQKII